MQEWPFEHDVEEDELKIGKIPVEISHVPANQQEFAKGVGG
jgi:hypothetical protein